MSPEIQEKLNIFIDIFDDVIYDEGTKFDELLQAHRDLKQALARESIDKLKAIVAENPGLLGENHGE